jgi:hypothetical protein
MTRSSQPFSQDPDRTKEAPHDTVAGCRERAEASLASAALTGSANGRRRLESSAASWTSRADLIERIDDSHDAHRAAEDASREAPKLVHGGTDAKLPRT